MGMMISRAETGRALARIAAGSERAGSVPAPRKEVPEELVERVRARIAEVPDVREDRMAKARRDLDGAGLDSSAVAEKMLARLVSDSIR